MNNAVKQRSLPVAAVVALRPRQWAKNVLVFAAPLAAGKIFQPDIFWPSVGAFIAFCLISSATYLVNDARDVESDKTHPKKSRRPIAAGELPIPMAIAIAIVLAALSLIGSYLIQPALAGIVLAYAIFTLSYSLFLKHEPVIELALLS
ncbi:MAG: UbiA family prenyltransferase, partial [Candidatus Nanopelagicales bacterium]